LHSGGEAEEREEKMFHALGEMERTFMPVFSRNAT
jgi:hypothetical protein